MKKFFYRLIQLILIGIILFSGYKIYNYFSDRHRSNESFKAVEKQIEVYRKPVTGEAKAPKKVDYEGMIRKLKEINSDIVGYIDIQGTQNHYPVVQAKDNNYYLRRGLDEEYSAQGTPFLDYLNAADFTDQNSVIYAHTMDIGEEMFGVLKHFIEQDYVDKSPKTFTITREDGIYHYRMFAGYRVSATADYRIANMDEEAFIKFLNDTYDASDVKMGPRPNFTAKSRIVTLSTCTDDHDADYRNAICGILEKIETKDGIKTITE